MSKKNNLIYYIGNNIELEFSDFNNGFDLDDLISMGITFNCDYPLSDGTCYYGDNVNKAISKNKLSKLLINWFYIYNENMESNDNIGVPLVEFMDVISNYLIINYNKKLKKYFIVKEHIIEDRLYNIFNHSLGGFFESIDLKEIKNFDTSFDIFINKIESLIEKETCHIYVSMDDGTTDFIITKKDSYFHKQLLKHKILPDEEINSKRNFIYEYGFEKFKIYFNYFLKKEKHFGISLSVNLFNDNENPDLKMFKKYGFFAFIENEKLIINQISASEVLESYTKNSLTGEKINPSNNFIYCGVEKDDLICGFDLN